MLKLLLEPLKLLPLLLPNEPLDEALKLAPPPRLLPESPVLPELPPVVAPPMLLMVSTWLPLPLAPVLVPDTPPMLLTEST